MVTLGITTGDIADTMSTKGGYGRARQWIAAIAAFSVGVVLVIAAVPRITAAWIVLPASEAVRAIDDGRPVSLEDGEAAYDLYSEALAWRPDDPVLLHDRARLAGRLAVLESELASQWRRRAVEDFRKVVALSPGNGTAWVRLAKAEIDAGADVEEVLPKLRLARLTAPSRASALLPLFLITMQHWDEMPDDLRSHALAAVPIFWTRRSMRPLLVAAYLDAGFEARAAFRERLGEKESALPAFDRLIASPTSG